MRISKLEPIMLGMGGLFIAAIGIVGSIVAASGCAFFTPARVLELKDIACVIAHYELPDIQLGDLCGISAEEVPAARAQARASYAASVQRERDGGLP